VAGDLIPPPSPAGRPAPDPEHPPAIAAEPLAEHEAAPSRPPGPSQFRARFGFLTGVLAGCAVAATVLLALLLTGGDGARKGGGEDLAAGWSTWHPKSTDTLIGAREIADAIEGNYRDAKSKQLAKVTGGPIALGVVPLSVAIPSDGEFKVLDGTGIQYTLGGFGEKGRLKGTEPSRARHRLLRREALELSLYSFRYLPEVTMVVALLPPAPKAEQVHPKPKGGKAKAAAKAPAYQEQAIFFRPGDLKQELAVPLSATMAPKPPKLDELTGEEARRIDTLTLSNLFTYDRVQQQDGRAYLVLERPS
jgi:hypothetical protein